LSADSPVGPCNKHGFVFHGLHSAVLPLSTPLFDGDCDCRLTTINTLDT
jgi:hypothetical protein